jgi:hypothetical protein
MREFATVFTTQVITVDEAPGVRGTDESWDDEDVIDSVLRLVADHHRAVGAAIGKRSFSPSLAELRQSPLGQDLRLQETVGRVTDLLLRPLAAEGMIIPAWFWRSAIGKMVARAARVTYGDDGLMSIADAADRLEIAPAIVAGWTTDGAIATIPDEGGRLLVPRDAIEKRRAVARELADLEMELEIGEDVLVREQRLAS